MTSRSARSTCPRSCRSSPTTSSARPPSPRPPRRPHEHPATFSVSPAALLRRTTPWGPRVSVLVVGISHRSAPIALLEQLAIDRDGIAKLVEDVLANPHVSEATAVVTCNRLEIYAAVDRFHGSVEDLSQRLLAPASQGPAHLESLLPHLYVHYDDGAVSHLFRVAAGLDSMAVGEAQILGQTRVALAHGQDHGTVGPVFNTLFQQALRVAELAYAETGIDRAAPTLVSAALESTTPALGGRRVVVVGAGGMA